MSKRKYDQYGDIEATSKHSQRKNISDSDKIGGERTCQDVKYSTHRQESGEGLKQDINALHSVDQCPSDGRDGGRLSRIGKLLDTLNDFLHNEDENAGQIHMTGKEDTVSQCKALRKLLRKQNVLISTVPAPLTPSLSERKTDHSRRVDKELPHAPYPSSLTPWTSASIPKTFPTLPEIKSPSLETATFTHSGATTNASALSYERLEWLGDAYLYLLSTMLISSTFTSHLPGKCSQIREILVKNETLAHYARRYGFEERARLPAEFSDIDHKGYMPKEGERIKVMGDIFEAYVAAVILSDPDHGVDRASSWLKALWAQTISKQIKEQDKLNEKIKAMPASNALAKLNPKDTLTKKIGARGVKITYRDAGPEKKDPVTGFPLFTIGVYLEGWGERDKLLGIGRALGKKDAGMKAAEIALANKKLMGLYGEMKQVYDEKSKAEKERAAAELQSSD